MCCGLSQDSRIVKYEKCMSVEMNECVSRVCSKDKDHASIAARTVASTVNVALARKWRWQADTRHCQAAEFSGCGEAEASVTLG